MAELSIQDQAVEALARRTVAELSPAELPLFKATAARYRADPAAVVSPKRTGPDTLGFGVETAVVLLTPYALDLIKRMFNRLSEKLGDSVADSLATRISKWLSPKPAEKAAKPEPLTPEQLALIAETTRSEAAALTLPPGESERLADAVVAALATRT